MADRTFGQGARSNAAGLTARELGAGRCPQTQQVHSLGEPVTLNDVAHAHAADLQHQDEHGVHYLRYWVDETIGKIFCLVDAPTAEAAATVHRKAHGLVATEIYPVLEGV